MGRPAPHQPPPLGSSGYVRCATTGATAQAMSGGSGRTTRRTPPPRPPLAFSASLAPVSWWAREFGARVARVSGRTSVDPTLTHRTYHRRRVGAPRVVADREVGATVVEGFDLEGRWQALPLLALAHTTYIRLGMWGRGTRTALGGVLAAAAQPCVHARARLGERAWVAADPKPPVGQSHDLIRHATPPPYAPGAHPARWQIVPPWGGAPPTHASRPTHAVRTYESGALSRTWRRGGGAGCTAPVGPSGARRA